MYLRSTTLLMARMPHIVHHIRNLSTVQRVSHCNRIASYSCNFAVSRTFANTIDGTKKTTDATAAAADAPSPPQILSKLFPQTSGVTSEEEEKKDEQKKAEEKKKDDEKSWKRTKIGFYIFGAVAVYSLGLVVYEMGAPEYDREGNAIEDEFSNQPLVPQYLKRTWKSLIHYQKVIQEPSRDKLLPDPLKPPYYQPKYTLVLEFKDVLVHPDWTYQTGWRFKKRPGVDTFLEQLAGDFEIVVFTAEQGMTVFPILDALDPKGYIMYRLVRDATHFIDGHHVKNLENLNRDLSKVIVLDWNPNSTKMHAENTFHVDRWLGNDDDLQLLDLVAFLKTIASADVNDVRDVLRHYGQFDNPLGQFKENQRVLAQQMHEKELEEQTQPASVVKQWTPSFFGRR